jgi:hypothetical protein
MQERLIAAYQIIRERNTTIERLEGNFTAPNSTAPLTIIHIPIIPIPTIPIIQPPETNARLNTSKYSNKKADQCKS